MKRNLYIGRGQTETKEICWMGIIDKKGNPSRVRVQSVTNRSEYLYVLRNSFCYEDKHCLSNEKLASVLNEVREQTLQVFW